MCHPTTKPSTHPIFFSLCSNRWLVMKQTELVFIPSPGIGHLAATVEIAKLMTHRDRRLSITILIMKFPFGSNDSMTSDSDSIRFLTLPPVEVSPGTTGITEFLKPQIPLVRDAVHEITRSNSVRLGGFVIDMFCTSMIDVADEFEVPSYLFFTSSAAFLGFMFHLQFLHDYEGLDFNEFKDSHAELEVPSYANPVPGKVFPSVMFDKEGCGAEKFLYHTRRFRQVKGIMVNTLVELESHAIQSFSGSTIPPVYPVGPVLNTQGGSVGRQQDDSAVMTWLDDQPPSSVLFLCFGSMGSFGGDQVKEIAHGLERSGHRFLWSLRQPPPKGKIESPSNYANVEEVLPEGFLHRTARIGKVIGWAPQVAILAHSAVGGFVSHCGWNSTLESIYYGVPVATWPMFAEQQINAFQMVKDLGLAVEIKMDYNKDSSYIVSAQEIEIGLKNLMNIDNEVRKKREEMKKISRKVMIEGGSSHFSLGHFIEDVIDQHSM
ncbi:UDP-glucose flavonoid 3-O-glucosyltransferase 6 [Vitis vinifera]|uniref:Glycosyltransferase n=1 Tax=Vitis vinifera TaxID=29760 RepID=A0A438HCU5_VITVI|nr:UDP-glucose flavonoid 3-O-glucosyltransferase 6 [Vitis vinifera]